MPKNRLMLKDSQFSKYANKNAESDNDEFDCTYNEEMSLDYSWSKIWFAKFEIPNFLTLIITPIPQIQVHPSSRSPPK